MSVQDYWTRVALQRESLPPGDVIYIASISSDKTPGMAVGVVSEVRREIAAQRIAAMTHRLAEAHEVDAFHAAAKQRTDDLAALEAAKKQQFALPKELQDLVAAALVASHPQPPPNPKKQRGD